MYAVVKTGGKQYRVAENDVIRVEKLDLEAGSKVKLDNVLLIGDDKKITIGAPMISGASVEATVVEQMRDRKVIIFKKIRRHNYRRKNGHRQQLTVVKVSSINA